MVALLPGSGGANQSSALFGAVPPGRGSGCASGSSSPNNEQLVAINENESATTAAIDHLPPPTCQVTAREYVTARGGVRRRRVERRRLVSWSRVERPGEKLIESTAR